MSYKRVIPRDLFNEGNLLKCLGALALAIEGKEGVTLQHGGGEFDIIQDAGDGSIRVGSVLLLIDGRAYDHKRPLNSREPWPLYVQRRHDHDAEEIEVFDDSGALTPEFVALLP